MVRRIWLAGRANSPGVSGPRLIRNPPYIHAEGDAELLQPFDGELDMTENCQECRYWKDRDDEDGHPIGDCRRFPPYYEGWPTTWATDWCGEWSAKAECD